MDMKVLSFICFLLAASQSSSLLTSKVTSAEKKIIGQLDKLLQKNMANGLFDGIGSIDVAVWKRDYNKKHVVSLYSKSYGKSQVKSIKQEISGINTDSPWKKLKAIADKYLPSPADVVTDDNNLYRIASNTKTFIGTFAHLMVARFGLNLDEKVHPTYVNLSSLGVHHHWNNPSPSYGYLPNFPSSSKYMESITFRHLLTHTSGLSRESKRGSMYAYGSSRTSTPRCPSTESRLTTLDSHRANITCTASSRDNNWIYWTKHIIKFMMPSCGYNRYNEISRTQTSCLPGEYYHYSNVGYSILGLALNSYIQNFQKLSITDWIKENIFRKLNMHDTEFTWVNYNKEQKRRSVQGCQGGLDVATCNQTRALIDYADRGLKTIPGGMWSTTSDLAKYLLNVQTLLTNKTSLFEVDKSFSPKVDDQSEEDITQMPLSHFKYSHGWYIAEHYSCLNDKYNTQLQGGWGTVPGFTSYILTNSKPKKNESQYAIVMLRSYNYAARFNLGNQARRFLWRLLHPEVVLSTLQCPVVVKDRFSEGDTIFERGSSSYVGIANAALVTILTLANIFIEML